MKVNNSQVKATFLFLLGCFVGVCPAQAEPSEADRHFLERVKPLLESRCVSCHGVDKQKGGLRLDSREAALKGGELGAAVVPGSPSASLLLQAVMHSKKDLEMPPKEKLTSRDIEILEKWIKDGAPWPNIPASLPVSTIPEGEKLGDAWSDPRNPIVRMFGWQRLDLWSLKPPARPPLPSVRHARWPRNAIDYFVLSKLEEKGVKPTPEANRRVLARRLYYDLTGLPPSPEQLEEFLQDRSPDAYERLVSKLLTSREYSEHWARQWLDVVRYSDSNGFDWDEFRPLAWRFRDYVIRSFSEDKPFDQFIREQLAGDELLEGPPRSPKDQDLLIATGYLRLGPHDNSAPLFNEQARSRAELMADLVETTGSAFLGLTMSCCRCHDHKYDPLSQADHFRMRAFFEGVKFADDLPLDLAEEQEEIRKHNDQITKQIKILEKEKEKVLAGTKLKLRQELIEKLSREERAPLGRKGEANEELKKQLEELEKKISPAEKDILAALAEPEKAQHNGLKEKMEELKKQRRNFTHGLLMTDAAAEPPVTHILFQGDHKQEREAVPPGFISALDPNPAIIQKGPNPKTTGRRLTLANWIASPENPLTARVLVNRVWQGHFGRGLVETPNDFGLAGSRPTNQDLLDWLATEFVRGGWSLKKLHYLIVTSATYRQGSSQPPATASNLIRIGAAQAKSGQQMDQLNQLLWRQNLRRLSAEQLRDSILAVSGLFKTSTGGPPVWPELPKEVLTANPAFLDDNDSNTKGWYPSPEEKQPVRSIYLIQKRTVRVPFMEAFDLPENTTSCPRRTESIVAPQALTLMNGRMTIQASQAFAQRVENEAGSNPEAQISRAFHLALQRAPDPQERLWCNDFLQRRGLPELCRALLNLNEFLYID